jgi:hypothetical protein
MKQQIENKQTVNKAKVSEELAEEDDDEEEKGDEPEQEEMEVNEDWDEGDDNLDHDIAQTSDPDVIVIDDEQYDFYEDDSVATSGASRSSILMGSMGGQRHGLRGASATSRFSSTLPSSPFSIGIDLSEIGVESDDDLSLIPSQPRLKAPIARQNDYFAAQGFEAEEYAEEEADEEADVDIEDTEFGQEIDVEEEEEAAEKQEKEVDEEVEGDREEVDEDITSNPTRTTRSVSSRNTRSTAARTEALLSSTSAAKHNFTNKITPSSFVTSKAANDFYSKPNNTKITQNSASPPAVPVQEIITKRQSLTRNGSIIEKLDTKPRTTRGTNIAEETHLKIHSTRSSTASMAADESKYATRATRSKTVIEESNVKPRSTRSTTAAKDLKSKHLHPPSTESIEFSQSKTKDNSASEEKNTQSRSIRHSTMSQKGRSTQRNRQKVDYIESEDEDEIQKKRKRKANQDDDGVQLIEEGEEFDRDSAIDEEIQNEDEEIDPDEEKTDQSKSVRRVLASRKSTEPGSNQPTKRAKLDASPVIPHRISSRKTGRDVRATGAPRYVLDFDDDSFERVRLR